MASYKSTFKLADGTPFPPLHVNAKIDHTGVFRTHWRGPGHQDLPRGGSTLKGAKLLRTGVVDVPQSWWDYYYHLRYGRPLPEGVEPVVEKGGVVAFSWEALLRHYKAHNAGWLAMKPGTREGYACYQDRIIALLGPHKVAQTKPHHVEQLINKVRFGDPEAADEKERKPRPMAAKMYRTVLGLLYEHARKAPLQWVEVNPVRDIQKPKSLNKKGLHTLTPNEVEALRLAYPDYASDERAYLEMGVHWGPRASDLCQLGWKNIANGEVRFTPIKTENSTGAEVVLPVKGEHLLAVLAHRSKTDTFFFQQPPKGANQWNRDKLVDLNPRCWDYTRARKTFKEMRERAGITVLATSHSMRKYFGTKMADAGASLTDIADALGDTEESARVYVAGRNKRNGSARAFHAALAAA